MFEFELYALFSAAAVLVLKEVNTLVYEPYMDEPFHIPQAQAYCEGNYTHWDPKITTPPGLYILSLMLKKLFLFKCNLSMLRLTPALCLLALPVALSQLISHHKRERPPSSLLSPLTDATVLTLTPCLWFYGFLYYTEVPSVLFVVLTINAAWDEKHWRAALLGLASLTFRQTNVVWVLYAYASSQLEFLRFRRPPPGSTAPLPKLHDPPALEASINDIPQTIRSLPAVVPDLLRAFIPYSFVLASFATFVVWNGGIVLGDKSNHIPTLHVPQLYYFVGFCSLFGWPVLVSKPQSGILGLLREVYTRMFGSRTRTLVTAALIATMCTTVHFFTIHHPFLLSDNRHYTFYLWRRVFLFHASVPYLLTPLYLAAAWAWFVRIGTSQTLLQTLLIPILVVPTLLPTPLLEPRYFVVPYVLLRASIPDVPTWAVALEGLWYALINALTMGVFLYRAREGGVDGIVRFMW